MYHEILKHATPTRMIRLARVAQAVRSRNSLPDCCCGYTLDQAVALENQVREWQDTLPAFLKISGDDETQSTTAGSNAKGALRRLQAYELAIASNVLVINVYMPFLGLDGEDGIRSRFTNLPAASACIHAAQAIVHLADGLQSLLSSPSVSSSFPSKVMPLMFQFIPLEKLVFDAVVVCAHATFAGRSPSMAFSTGMMADDAFLGLKVLRKLGPPLLSSVIERDDDDEFQSRVIGTLHVRLVQRSMRLKRKLEEEIICEGLYTLLTLLSRHNLHHCRFCSGWPGRWPHLTSRLRTRSSDPAAYIHH